MKRIDQLTLPNGLEIDLLFENGKLAYTFVHNDKTYGNAVKLPSRKVQDIASSCVVLFSNALSTKEMLVKQNGEQTN